MALGVMQYGEYGVRIVCVFISSIQFDTLSSVERPASAAIALDNIITIDDVFGDVRRYRID